MNEDSSDDPLTVYCAKSVTANDRVLTVSGTMQTENGDRVLTVDASGPGYDPLVFVGRLTVATAGTIAWVKTWPDGHTFGAGDISAKAVSQYWPDYLYIEEDNRYSGIRIEKTVHGRITGQRVNVVGSLGTNSSDERYIAASSVDQNGTGTVNPYGMINKQVGGGDFVYSAGPPAYGQRGVLDGYGLNNIGLLVHAWGKITESDSQWFKISDGSNVSLKVAYPPFAYVLNDYVAIAGISSCEADTDGDIQRVLRPQPLTCTINQATGQADSTNTSPVNFAVTFNDPVTGFSSDDVSISGTAGGTKTITVTPTGSSGKAFNVAVTGMTSGTVIATIPSGKALSLSGLWNYASTSTDNTVTFDIVAPTVTAFCCVPPYILSGFDIQFAAVDNGGSNLKEVRFYKKAAGSWGSPFYTSTAVFSGYLGPIVPTSGLNEYSIVAVDNAGNESQRAESSFSYETTPPVMGSVYVDNIIPTSQLIHARWDTASDASGVYGYYYWWWYQDDTTGGKLYYNSGNATFTQNREAILNLGGLPPLNNANHPRWGATVLAVDNCGNVGAEANSAPRYPQKIQVGFLWYNCMKIAVGQPGYYGYSNIAFFVDYYLQRFNLAFSPSIVQYNQITSAPATIHALDNYDVLFVVLPKDDFTQTEKEAIKSLADIGFHKRLVFVGDYGRTGYPPNEVTLNVLCNQRLNILAEYVGIQTRFHANENMQTYDGSISNSRVCSVSTHYLTTGVTGLWDAAISELQYAYEPYAHKIAFAGTSGYTDKCWIAEEDVTNDNVGDWIGGCSRVLIHDSNIMNLEYDNYFSNPNLFGLPETTSDSVPNKNFKFLANLCSKFTEPQQQ